MFIKTETAATPGNNIKPLKNGPFLTEPLRASASVIRYMTSTIAIRKR